MAEKRKLVSMGAILKPVQFAVITLRYRHDLRPKEIAVELGMSRQAVEKHIRAALDRMSRERGLVIDFDASTN